jgi:hypothetical protein
MAVPPLIDEISPETMGEDRILLSLDRTSLTPRAFQAVLINVDYSACAPEGVVLPLELLIQTPSISNIRRHIIRKIAPRTLSFIPKEGGLHGVLLRELGHNRWLGKLRVTVAGDPLIVVRPT